MLTMSSGLSMERMMVCRLRGTPLSWARWYTSSHCCHLLFSLQNISRKNGKVKSHCLFIHDLTSTPPVGHQSQFWCSPPSGRRTPPMSPVQPQYQWPGNSGTWQPGDIRISRQNTLLPWILGEYRNICTLSLRQFFIKGSIKLLILFKICCNTFLKLLKSKWNILGFSFTSITFLSSLDFFLVSSVLFLFSLELLTSFLAFFFDIGPV